MPLFSIRHARVCALKYNRTGHTLDCPCHGSHFTEQGKLIDNPATDNKRI